MANVTITADGIVQVIKIGEVITGPQGPQGVQGEPGKPLRYEDLTPTQKAELKGPKGEPGNPGAPGKDGKSLRYEDLTEQQKAELKGAKGDPGTPGAPGKDGKPGTTDYNQLDNKPDPTRYVSKSGDTMTGNLVLSTNTAVPLELATNSTSGWQEFNMSHMGGGTQNTIIFNARNSANTKTRYAQIQAFMFDRQRALGSVIISTNSAVGMRNVATFLAGELRLESSRLTFGASDVAMIAGNGMPNGKVLAPVGSTYIDRDATNGAIRWIKKTGGNSVNGWAVDYGDTGWRNITPNPLPANIDKTDCKIRRVNDVVEVAIGYTNVINATEMVYTNSLPLGFRPAQNVFVTGTSTGPGTSRTGGVAIDGTRIRWQSTVGNWRTAYARYTTDDAWPATLPGA
jgi:hypothetical protein